MTDAHEAVSSVVEMLHTEDLGSVVVVPKATQRACVANDDV